MGPIGPLSVRRLYRVTRPDLREAVDPGAGRQVDWLEAERIFPECSAAWDRDIGQETVSVLVVLGIGPSPGVLVAGHEGSSQSSWYIEGEWRPYSVQIGQSSGFIKVSGPSGDIFVRKLRSPDGGGMEIAGPRPDQVPGSHAPVRPNGKVSAVVDRGHVDAGTIGASLDAITAARSGT